MGLRMVFFGPKSGLTSGGVASKKLAFEEIQELLEEEGLQGLSGADHILAQQFELKVKLS